MNKNLSNMHDVLKVTSLCSPSILSKDNELNNSTAKQETIYKLFNISQLINISIFWS